jgi:hypothetical protein
MAGRPVIGWAAGPRRVFILAAILRLTHNLYNSVLPFLAAQLHIPRAFIAAHDPTRVRAHPMPCRPPVAPKC